MNSQKRQMDSEKEFSVIPENKNLIFSFMQVIPNGNTHNPKTTWPFEKPFTAKVFAKGPAGKIGVQSTGFSKNEAKTSLWNILISHKLTNVIMSF